MTAAFRDVEAMHRRVEDALRETLRERAAGVPPEADPWERTQRAIARERRRRRILGVVVLAALLVVGSLVGLALRSAPARAPAPRQPSQSSAGRDPASWPLRGSLAGDRAWRRGALEVARRSYPSPRTARLVFAGDVPGGRLAIAVGADGHEAGAGLLATAWYADGRPEPARLRPDGVFNAASAPLVWAHAQPDGKLSVVALAPSALSLASVSAGPTYGSDGSVSRELTWVANAPDNGVVVASVPGRGPALVRFLPEARQKASGGSTLSRRAVPVNLLRLPKPPALLGLITAGAVDAYAGPVDRLNRSMIEDAVRSFFLRHGGDPQDLDVRIAFAGRISARVRAVALLFRQLDGSVLQVVRTSELVDTTSRGEYVQAPVDGVPIPWQEAARWPFRWREQAPGDALRVHVIAPTALRAELVYPPDTRLGVAELHPGGYGRLDTSGNPRLRARSLQLRLPQADGTETVTVPLQRAADEDPLGDRT